MPLRLLFGVRRALSQFPDTPLHSSETPRSSSLYQPESDEECRVRAGNEGNPAVVRDQEGGGGEEEEDDDNVIHDDHDNNVGEQRLNSDISEDVADETDHRPTSSSESVSAEEVLESEEAAQEEEEEES